MFDATRVSEAARRIGRWTGRTEKEIYEYLGRPIEYNAAQYPHNAHGNAELHSQAVDQNGDYMLEVDYQPSRVGERTAIEYVLVNMKAHLAQRTAKIMNMSEEEESKMRLTNPQGCK